MRGLGILAALALVTLAEPARAQVVTLICSTTGGYSETLDIDRANATVCTLASFGRPPCARDPAQIGDRYVT